MGKNDHQQTLMLIYNSP